MRHKVFGRKLNRDVKERRALFKNLVSSLIIYGRIKTTISKARAIRGLVEKLVTRAKDGSNSAVRQISSILNRKDTVNKLISEVAPRFKDKLGGYLRIVKMGNRRGDNAQEVIMEWSVSDKKEEKKKPLTKEVNKKEKEVKKV